MGSFNRVIIVGNLTREIELRYTPGGTAVSDVSLAVNSKRKDGNGELIEEVDFIDCTLWGRTAEVAGEYLTKGSAVMFEGRLKQDRWEDEQGNKRSKIKVVVEKLNMIGSKRNGDDAGSGGNSNNRSNSNSGNRNQSSGRNGNQTKQRDTDYGPPPDEYSQSGATSQGTPPDDDIPFVWGGIALFLTSMAAAGMMLA